MTKDLIRERTAELRECLISRIANEKAYNVPSYCVALGLADGDENEAFSSKAKYASRRLTGQSLDVLILAAERALADTSDFQLEEACHKAKEASSLSITPVTRRRLLEVFATIPLSTEVSELEFLRLLWPTESLFPTADYGVPYDPFAGKQTMDDILWHQMVKHDRWGGKQALEALGWMDASEALVFRLLEAAVGPMHRSAAELEATVTAVNEVLRHDHFVLAVAGKMSGSPFFQIARLQQGSPADTFISHSLKSYDQDTIHRRWETALERRSVDPEGAITLARTLLEDVCRWILDEAEDGGAKDHDDLPKLYAKLARVLNLAPDGHTEHVFKQILGSCQQIVEQLGALRNRVSDAHSAGPRKVKPKARHAELAVNLSGAMAMFLVSTWLDPINQAQNSSKSPEE